MNPALQQAPTAQSILRMGRPTSQNSHSTTLEVVPPLAEYYNSLFAALGPQHWWPGKTKFEIIAGTILTQNTSWKNVEPAIAKLRAAGALTPSAIEKLPIRRLQSLIRSSGYFRQKAKALKAFSKFLTVEYRGSLARMFDTPTIALREKLLGVWGIGPETADSILLYAGGHAVFVADGYAKRMLARHGWISADAKYEDVRWIFEKQFFGNGAVFNEYHALIVATGKKWCRPGKPNCKECPLGRYLETGR